MKTLGLMFLFLPLWYVLAFITILIMVDKNLEDRVKAITKVKHTKVKHEAYTLSFVITLSIYGIYFLTR